MAKHDDVRAALERELAGYERMGDTDRAKQVRDQIGKVAKRGRKRETETTSSPENAAEHTGGLSTEDLGALGNQPRRAK
jgi:hypothetical protein